MATRRSLAGGAAMALLGTATAIAGRSQGITSPEGVPDAHPDAELLDTTRRAIAASDLLHQCDRQEIDLTEEQVEAAITVAFDGGEKLMTLRPRTAEGMKAKAAFVQSEFHRLVVSTEGETMESCGEYHERLAWSLINDVAGRPPV